MKHTKNNCITLLKVMEETAHSIAHNTTYKGLKEDMFRKSMELQNVIAILTDKEYFNDLCDIYELN